MVRNTLSVRIRRYRFPDLPSHYMQPKKKTPPITTSEAAKLRWKGVSAEERTEIARRAVLKRWYPKGKKKVKKTP